MDAIHLLETQQREIRMLFSTIAGLAPCKAKADLFRALAGALDAHALLEERHLYPALLQAPAATKRRSIARQVADLGRMGVSSPRFDAALASLRASVETRFAEEKSVLFPALTWGLRVPELSALGEAMRSTMRELSHQASSLATQRFELAA
jgi:hypothetical protein